MRHGKKFNHLGRTASHRAALLSNMAASLILHKRIRTTLAKAKALRVYVEPLLTKSKADHTHSRRVVFSYLQNKDAVRELFTDVAPRIADRPGGYTRILKLGPRKGDGAELALIELVDYNEYLAAESRDKKSRRTRRSKKSDSDASPQSIVGKATSAVSNAAAAVAETASEVNETVVDTVSDVAESVADSVSDAAENLVDTVSDVAESVSETVSDAVESAGEAIEDLKFEDGDAPQSKDEDKKEGEA